MLSILTTTGFSMLLFALGFIVGGKRFSEALRTISSRNSSRNAKMLSIQFLSVGIQNYIVGIGGEFFYNSPNFMKITLIISNIFLTIHSMLGVVIVYNIFYPNYKKIIPISLIGLLGISLISLTIFYPIETEIFDGNINMNLPINVSYLIFMMILISGISISSIFFKIYIFNPISSTRYFALSISILLCVAVFSAFLRVVLYGSQIVPNFVNIMFSIIGVVLIFLFTIPNFLQKRI